MSSPADLPARIALMEAGLELVADRVGDITGPVVARLYRRCPAARASFVRLGLGRPDALAAQMVETTLHCLMSWPGDRAMVEITLRETLPHHCLTLGIAPAVFRALAEETAHLIIAAIPADCAAERAVWEDIRTGILGAIAEAERSPLIARAAVQAA
jgi:hypothetical protein